MTTKLNWKKGFFDTTYRIFLGKEQVGQLHDNSFRQKASGNLFTKEYRFKTLGFFSQNTIIIDGETNIEIGSIVYNTLHTKATVTLFKKTYNWQYNNIWNTKWSLYDADKLLVDSVGTTLAGTIETPDNDALLILTSLYITNYYWQSTIVIFIALIPVYISILS